MGTSGGVAAKTHEKTLEKLAFDRQFLAYQSGNGLCDEQESGGAQECDHGEGSGAFHRAGVKKIEYLAGVDEVGRGPLCGPVVCAAVIMPLQEGAEELLIDGVNDSKKLSEKRREELNQFILSRALAYAVCEVNEKVIDEMNILQATRLCMKNALSALKISPDLVLTDGNMTLDVTFLQKSVIHGDALSYSIGAASIVAKVYRDALMDEFAKKYPEYGFERNKGYGTAEHMRAIKEYGLCPIHRKTFVKKV